MKALVSTQIGGPDTLVIADLPDPVPGPGEVRLAVRACGINYLDSLIIEDQYQVRPPRPFAPGIEVAGTIDAVGEGVTTLVPGQRVMATLRYGGMAELAVTNAALCTVIPDAMPFEVAASFQVTYGTVYHALVDRAGLKRGETLLVMGAAGGVGLAAVELGKALGARVVAAVSSVAKGQVARDHGADEVVTYPLQPRDQKVLGAAFKAACPQGIDVVFDPLGGAYAEPALRCLAWAGRYLVIGFAAGIPAPPWNLALLKEASVLGVYWGAWIERFALQNRDNTAALLDLYTGGELKPLVSATFPLAEGGEAIRRLASRQAVGKVVVTI